MSKADHALITSSNPTPTRRLFLSTAAGVLGTVAVCGAVPARAAATVAVSTGDLLAKRHHRFSDLHLRYFSNTFRRETRIGISVTAPTPLIRHFAPQSARRTRLKSDRLCGVRSLAREAIQNRPVKQWQDFAEFAAVVQGEVWQ